MENEENKNPKPSKKENENARNFLVQKSSFSGPIPHPSVLQGYEDILPGLADRITKMAENQSKHRQKLEARVILVDGIKSILGLVFAFLIVIAALVAGVYTAIMGNPIFGGVVSLASLGVIVGAFIYQKKSKT